MSDASLSKNPTLSDLAPKGVDGRIWVKTLKQQLLSARPDGLEPPDEDLLYYARVCQASELDPAKREIYGIYRSVKQRDGTYKPKLSIQTSIDGLRVTAERSGKYGGSEEPEFEYDEQYQITVQDRGSTKRVPNKARVTVLKLVGNKIVKTTRSANWADYFPGDREGNMWKKLPETMLAKVAEAQALRAAFPNVTSGLYIEEEMQQANDPETTGLDLTKLKADIGAAANLDDLMEILGEYTPEVQKQIAGLVDARAKELREL